jgi:hypothetical protein
MSRRIALTSIAALLLAIVPAWHVSTAMAQPAHPNYVSIGSFATSVNLPESLASPKRLAVDPVSHDILITDSQNNRVVIFEPDGSGSATFLSAFGVGELVDPYGLAVDPNTSNVYVADAGNNRIVRYLRGAGAAPTYTMDAGYVGPAFGSGSEAVGSFATAIAVDPVTGDLLIADSVNRRVSRYGSDGDFVRSFDGSTSSDGSFAPQISYLEPGLSGLTDIAVGPAGTITVTVTNGNVSNDEGPSLVQQFDANGGFLGDLVPVVSPRAVGVNPATGMVLAAGNSRSDQLPRIFGFLGGEAAGQVDLPESFIQLRGLAVDAGGSGLLYALTGGFFGSGSGGVQVFAPVLAPGVHADAPTGATSRSASAHGTVDAGGQDATPHFETSKDNGATWVARPDLDVVTGSGEVPVTDDLGDLEPNTTYLVRLVASNAGASSTTTPQSFRTAVEAPAVASPSATDRTTGGAILHASINPYGLQATYHFEYGLTTGYGSRVPVQTEGTVGNGRVSRPVQRAVTGLTPGTTYHFRVVARSSAGVTYGDDQSFTTPAAAEAGAWGYEQVSPVNKNGASIDAYAIQARADGNSVMYQATAAITSPDGAAPRVPRYLGVRGTDSWGFMPLDPPQFAKAGVQPMITATDAVSADQSHALVASNRALAPGARGGGGNLYRRDTRTGSYELIAAGGDTLYEDASGINQYGLFYGGNDDFSSIVFRTTEALTSDAVAGAGNLYEWNNGTLRLVDVLPDGTTSATGVGLGNGAAPAIRRLSGDTTKIYFAVDQGLYVRVNGTETIPVAVSQRPGDPDTPQAGRIAGVSRDGRHAVIMVDTGVPLTTDVPDGQQVSVYRFDLQTRSLQYLAGGAAVIPRGVNDDASVVYYQVVSDTADRNGLWVWRAETGTSSAIGPPDISSGSMAGLAISPSGRYLAFRSTQKLTSSDNVSKACEGPFDGNYYDGHCTAMYLVDSATGSLRCASCTADGSPPAGHVMSGFGAGLPLDPYEPRIVNDHGEVFFDTPSGLVVADSNGKRDVYAYRDGETRLVSGGALATTSRFFDASAEGDSVFFVTDDQLVKQDSDRTFDLYVARVDGGLAAQHPVAPRLCAGSECEEPGPGPAAPPPAGSVTFLGTGNVLADAPARSAKVSAAKVKAITGTVGTLRVTVPGRGKLVASGRGLVTVKRSTAKAATYRLKVSLNAQARKALKKARKVKQKVSVTFTPTSGKPSKVTLTLTFKAPATNRKGR